jgi:hypothetical protein
MNSNIISLSSYRNFQSDIEYGSMQITYSIELDGVTYTMSVQDDR